MGYVILILINIRDVAVNISSGEVAVRIPSGDVALRIPSGDVALHIPSGDVALRRLYESFILTMIPFHFQFYLLIHLKPELMAIACVDS